GRAFPVPPARRLAAEAVSGERRTSVEKDYYSPDGSLRLGGDASASASNWAVHSGETHAACHSSRNSTASARTGPDGGLISWTSRSSVASRSAGSGSSAATRSSTWRFKDSPARSAC